MIRLEANAYLVREGDPSTSAFLIEQGSVEVILERDDGDHILAVLGTGEMVGEMALVDGALRSASVRTREKSCFRPITSDQFSKRLDVADPVLRLVLGTILGRFRSTLNAIGSSGVALHCEPIIEESVRVAAIAELRLEKELQVALAQDQIVMAYQPIVHLASRRLVGFEALARWQHPSRGLIPPSTFIPMAEASGLSAKMAFVCMRVAARDLKVLQAQAARSPNHVETLKIAVNVSGHDLAVPDFVRDLGAIVAEEGQTPDRFTIELTETALVHTPSAASALTLARSLGFKVAVDDFGTGHASFAYVRTLPVDVLKIDRSFVQDMASCAITYSIVRSMLQLSGSLGLAVVAEGIETAADLEALEGLGCELGQGFLFGRPLQLEKTLDLVAHWTSGDGAVVLAQPAA